MAWVIRGVLGRGGGFLAAIGALALVGPAACVEKEPDGLGQPGRRPLTPQEKARRAKYILRQPPAKLRYKIGANLGDKIVYLGLHTPELAMVRGKPFTVIHYFQVKDPVPGWRLFVHTGDPKGKHHRNYDHIPVFGLYPVTAWRPGEIIADRHTITIPKTHRYSPVTLYVGIWRPRTGRLAVRSGAHDGKNRLIAARIPVVDSAAHARKLADKPRLRAATGADRPRYVAPRARGAIKIDGRADEADWRQAKFTRLFVNSASGAVMKEAARAKLLYDDENLYVFFHGADRDVAAKRTKRDDPRLWLEQTFQLLVDADGDGASYIEVQVNPLGALLDAFYPRPGARQLDWRSGLRAQVHVTGTLNQPGDVDQAWAAELALPWADVRGPRAAGAKPWRPRPGARLRVNLFRTDIGAKGVMRAWAWSPPRGTTFHRLERFGELVLGGDKAK